MKKIIVMAAILIGCSFGANAQKAQDKQIIKPGDLKTQKKGMPARQTADLKSSSTNTAIAPLFLPVPRPEVDTTFVPVVKNDW